MCHPPVKHLNVSTGVLFKNNVAALTFSYILSHPIAALGLEFCPLLYKVSGKVTTCGGGTAERNVILDTLYLTRTDESVIY